MRKFISVSNETYGEQKFLYEAIGDELKTVYWGDEYHDDISAIIEGFFVGLKYVDVNYEYIRLNTWYTDNNDKMKNSILYDEDRNDFEYNLFGIEGLTPEQVKFLVDSLIEIQKNEED